MNLIDSFFKLLRIRENDENIILFLEKSKADYLILLKNIEEILRKGKQNGQANFVEKLSKLITEKDFLKFKKEINSIDMWGGSGAVWEVYFHNENLQRKFNNQMLELIGLMERTKIIGRGIKSLKKFFRK